VSECVCVLGRERRECVMLLLQSLSLPLLLYQRTQVTLATLGSSLQHNCAFTTLSLASILGACVSCTGTGALLGIQQTLLALALKAVVRSEISLSITTRLRQRDV
jgi:hypothetical protein